MAYYDRLVAPPLQNGLPQYAAVVWHPGPVQHRLSAYGGQSVPGRGGAGGSVGAPGSIIREVSTGAGIGAQGRNLYQTRQESVPHTTGFRTRQDMIRRSQGRQSTWSEIKLCFENRKRFSTCVVTSVRSSGSPIASWYKESFDRSVYLHASWYTFDGFNSTVHRLSHQRRYLVSLQHLSGTGCAPSISSMLSSYAILLCYHQTLCPFAVFLCYPLMLSSHTVPLC